jgi:organic hydroperoxide reductase OsmC/OhrA
MQGYPHRYQVRASAGPSGDVTVASPGLTPLASGPPPQFGGRGDQWSPETLLVAAIVDCFILTFRAVARAAKLDWQSLDAAIEGTLDHVDRVTRFTDYALLAKLTVPAGTDRTRAEQLLEKAEHGCLISNSLNAKVRLVTTIVER